MPNKIKQFKPKGIKVKTHRATDERQKALGSSQWQKLRIEAKRRWVQLHGPYCGMCRKPLDFGRDTHVDHIERHSGPDDPKCWDLDNTQCLCSVCHGEKTRAEER